jgi:malate dehydrogenase
VGWRLRRRQRTGVRRAPRAVVVGEGSLARETARRLAAAGAAEVVLCVRSRGEADDVSRDFSGSVRPAIDLEGAAPADALIVCAGPRVDPAERLRLVRDVALWAARTCPHTALIIAAPNGLALSYEASRAGGMPPWLILSPGGLPRAAAAAARITRRLQVSPSQVCVPAIGGEEDETVILDRYCTAAGIPWRDLLDADARDAKEPAVRGAPGPQESSLALASALLARAVLQDRREVLSCGAWIESAFGLGGAFVTAPVPVGARGAEEPLPVRLLPEERALLQRAARREV